MTLSAKILIALLIVLPTAAHAETIHYKISKMGIGGKGDLTWVGSKKYKDHDTMLVTFDASGFNFKDREEIYLDPKTYRPLFVERDINIFGKKEKISEDYTTQGQIKITKDTDGKTSEQVIKKEEPVDNIYGFIYRYRKEGAFKIGDTIDVNLPTKQFKIKLISKTRLSYFGKKWDCYYMQSDPADYKIWFDASPKKLPLRINGGGNMIMTGYEE